LVGTEKGKGERAKGKGIYPLNLVPLTLNLVPNLTEKAKLFKREVLATLIFGFHGIFVTPIPISDSQKLEPRLKIFRDAIRAIVWLITGHSGSSLHNPDYRL